jgi:putative DNA primase/helicase
MNLNDLKALNARMPAQTKVPAPAPASAVKQTTTEQLAKEKRQTATIQVVRGARASQPQAADPGMPSGELPAGNTPEAEPVSQGHGDIKTKEITPMAEPPMHFVRHPNARIVRARDEQDIEFIFIGVCDNCRGSLAKCACGVDQKPSERLMWDQNTGVNQSVMDALVAAAAKTRPTAGVSAIEPKSFIYDPTYNSVPTELKDADRWLVFEVVWNAKTGKFTKTPYHAVTAKKTNNPDEGSSFAAAVAAQRNWNSPVERFVLGLYVESPLVVTDIDYCRDAKTGEIQPWALAIIRELDSWAEISPSGTGVHIINKGTKPGERCKKGIEMYSTGRPLTVTGVHVSGTPTTVNERNSAVASVYARMNAGDFLQHYKEKTEPSTAGSNLETKAKNDSTVVLHTVGNSMTTTHDVLMSGTVVTSTPFRAEDSAGNYVTAQSHSEADLSLVSSLLLKHDGDVEKVEEDFRQSSLYRDKWDREDYRERTIARALESYRNRAVPERVPTDEEHRQIVACLVAQESAEPASADRAPVAGEKEYDVDPESGQQISKFDPRTMKGIYQKIVDAVTKGTTLPPQLVYSVAKTLIGAMLAGKVTFQSLDGIQPTLYLTTIGRTGTGKGWAWRRTYDGIFNLNPQTRLDYVEVVNSADSAAGIRDRFFEIRTPMAIFVDELTNLGNKADQRKNPEILDIILELANSRSLSRVKARRSANKSGTMTKDDCDLAVVMCVPSGESLMRAFSGRKDEGATDRLFLEFAVPPKKGPLPQIDKATAVALQAEIYDLVRKYRGVHMEIRPEASEAIASYWGTLPEKIQSKVRFGVELELDAYLNAIGRGVFTVELEDVHDAITNFSRRLEIRKEYIGREVKDDTARYLAALKRITAQMAEEMKVAVASPEAVDPWTIAKSERDFMSSTNAYRDDEEHLFKRAWAAFCPTYLQPIQKAIQGQNRTKFYPAPVF